MSNYSLFISSISIQRVYLVNRSSVTSSKTTSLWHKLFTKWHDTKKTQFHLLAEHDKLSIIADEIEHVQFDYKRMKINAGLALDRLDVSFEECDLLIE